MSIEFNCPKCNALIAFDDKHAGKRARCATCEHRFIIPEASFQKPSRASQPTEEAPKDVPIPGFYRAALIGSWGVLFRWNTLVGLVFISAAVGFKFFVAHVDYSFVLMDRLSFILPFGLIVRILCWGILFWIYLESIVLGALDVDALPDMDIDGYGDLTRKAIRSVFAFFIALVFCLLPAVLYLLFSGKGYSLGMTHGLANLGLFFLPMCILAVGVNQNTQVLCRIDLLFAPVTKAFFPYLICAAMVMGVWFLQMKMHNAGDPALAEASASLKTLHLAMHLGIQILALVAMRSLGLYYRHYQCYFKW
jgi:hypothetical protein